MLWCERLTKNAHFKFFIVVMLQVTQDSEVTKVPVALKVLQVAMVIRERRETMGLSVTLGHPVVPVKMEPKGTLEKEASGVAMV